MADELPEPASRKEEYLAKAAGMDVEELPTPASREEQYLNAIAENGGGGGGGTSNFNKLTNRPKYNGVTMTGDTNVPEVKTYTAGTNVAISDQNVISATDTTYSAFTGTDGTAAGTAGLVPAPATTDAGKFLKADGTWDTAGGGSSVNVVQTTGTSTTDVMSQNATTSMVYADPSTKQKIKLGFNASNSGNSSISIGAYSQSISAETVAIGYSAKARGDKAIAIGSNVDYGLPYPGSVSLGAYSSASHEGEMNIGLPSATAAQQAIYGYSGSAYRLLTGLYDPQNAHDAATKGYVDGKVLSGAGAPTTSTVGTVGQIYEDTTNGKLYQCTAIIPGTDPDPDTYTWSEIGGGGSDTQIQLLTDDDANYTLDGDDYIAAWLLDGGTYKLDKDATVPLLINVEETSPNTYMPRSVAEADEQPLVLIERPAPDDPYNPVVIMVLYSQGCALCAADKTTGVEAASPVDAFGRFTGTDGTYNGVDGLVPAPQTTDADKFLKSDGTWATVGGGTGAVVELTTADYDYTIGVDSGIALWRLQAGLYHTANNVQAFAGSNSDFKLSLNSHLIIIDDSGNQKLIKVVGDDFSSSSNGVYKGFVQYKVAASDGSGTFAQSDSVVSTASLMIVRGLAPTSSDVGFRGQMWYDNTNNKLYVNVNKPSDYAGNWKEITIV